MSNKAAYGAPRLEGQAGLYLRKEWCPKNAELQWHLNQKCAHWFLWKSFMALKSASLCFTVSNQTLLTKWKEVPPHCHEHYKGLLNYLHVISVRVLSEVLQLVIRKQGAALPSIVALPKHCQMCCRASQYGWLALLPNYSNTETDALSAV